MAQIDYTIQGPLFPWTFGSRHLAAACTETTWEGRIIHVIVGLVEWIPIVNYVVAIFDLIIGQTSDVAGPASARHAGGVPPNSRLLNPTSGNSQSGALGGASEASPLLGRASSSPASAASKPPSKEDDDLAAAIKASLAGAGPASGPKQPPAAKSTLAQLPSAALYQELSNVKGGADKLKGFGILSAADLKALGCDELDEIEAELTPILREIEALGKQQIADPELPGLGEILTQFDQAIKGLDEKGMNYHRQIRSAGNASA